MTYWWTLKMERIWDGKNGKNYLEFEKKFVEALDKHAPKKTKIFQWNQELHINKRLGKAIIKRSRLTNKANKKKGPKDLLKYGKQCNYKVKLNDQSKQEHFDSLSPFQDSKPIWKSSKPSFSKNLSWIKAARFWLKTSRNQKSRLTFSVKYFRHQNAKYY